MCFSLFRTRVSGEPERSFRLLGRLEGLTGALEYGHEEDRPSEGSVDPQAAPGGRSGHQERCGEEREGAEGEACGGGRSRRTRARRNVVVLARGLAIKRRPFEALAALV